MTYQSDKYLKNCVLLVRDHEVNKSEDQILSQEESDAESGQSLCHAFWYAVEVAHVLELRRQ